MAETYTPNKRRVYQQTDPITGNPVYTPRLTESSRTDTVDLVLTIQHALPIVFVPGIMGSNLRSTSSKAPVWRLDSLLTIFNLMVNKDAGDRQKMLHPQRTEVDPDGAVPAHAIGALKTKADYQARGWGEVGATSYQDFLMSLEESLNGGKEGDGKHSELSAVLAKAGAEAAWGAQKTFEPLTPEQNKNAIKWYYPVYAMGYNWLDDNSRAAEKLQERINKVIADNNRGMTKCKQVIVVTHSMGGLVARACSKLPGMEDKIAGVVHGVMPATGAAVAYRRCKVGLADEGWGVGQVIGKSGQEVTAVFAQAPGALQLLPNTQYAANWLEVRDSGGTLLPEQPSTSDPYETIYKERNKWWGLVKEEWLTPKDGSSPPMTWELYKKAINLAKDFHNYTIKDHYHPNTYGFYGRGVPSFERVTWKLEAGDATTYGVQEAPPVPAQVMQMHRSAVRMDGTNPEEVPGPDVPMEFAPQQTSWYRLRLGSAKETGDGTVPVASGRAPLDSIRQLFAVAGVEHEPAYKNTTAQDITLYAINKIAQAAKAIV